MFRSTSGKVHPQGQVTCGGPSNFQRPSKTLWYLGCLPLCLHMFYVIFLCFLRTVLWAVRGFKSSHLDGKNGKAPFFLCVLLSQPKNIDIVASSRC